MSLRSRKLIVPAALLAGLIALVILGASIYSSVVNNTTKFKDYSQLAKYFSGGLGQNRTLILFSNNAEQRFGGGFIGSVGYVSVDSRKQAAIDPIHSVYYYDHRLEGSESQLQPAPVGLNSLASVVYLRDSGLRLDWRENAQAAAKLFILESGKPVDSVVMLTPTVIREMLKITGPIKLDSYGFSVTSDNFLDKVQLEVEAGGDKVAGKDPKTILGTLGNVLIARLYNDTSIQDLARFEPLLKQMSARKQLAVYSTRDDIEHLLGKLGLDGAPKPAEGNYLEVAEANYGANKSSLFVQQSVRQTLAVGADGGATAKLKITRKHTGRYQHQYVDPHDGQTKWLIGANLSQVKVAVPYGSTLTGSSANISPKVEREGNKTIYAFDSSLEPGGKAEYEISYVLPFRYDMGPRLTVKSTFELPTGGLPQQFEQKFDLPATYKPLTHFGPREIKQTMVLQSNFSR